MFAEGLKERKVAVVLCQLHLITAFLETIASLQSVLVRKKDLELNLGANADIWY
jgi:hypothetical protein